MVHECMQVAFVNALRELNTSGKDVAPRGAATKEVLFYQATILNPDNRFITLPERGANPFAQIAETLWMLAGRNDLDWLELFIPQVKKFSDDGRTWRAGYGPRLRKWPVQWNDIDDVAQIPWLDQIAKVMGKLRTDQDTRQAVITIWDPAQDWIVGSRDYPCNCWLHFIIRDDKLHLNVGVRSNDLVFGFSHVDFFGWSVLLELMANWVGVGMGTINWNATSMHIYERHFAMMRQVVEEAPHPYRTPAFFGVPSLPVFCPWDKFDKVLTHLTTWAQYWAVGYVYGSTTPPGHVLVEDLPWFNEAQKMLWLWAEFKHVQAGHAPVQIYNVLNNMVHSDMRVAALVYLSQRMDGFNWEAVELSREEQNYLTLRRLL